MIFPEETMPEVDVWSKLDLELKHGWDTPLKEAADGDG